MKTVILVWKHTYSNVVTDMNNNYHGIGDLLRSAYALFILSKMFNFRLILDYSLHCISEYLKPNIHEYSDLVKENSHLIPLVVEQVNIVNYIQLNKNPYVMLSCSIELDFYDIEFDSKIMDETKIFMKSILIPNDNFKTYIDNTFNNFPFKQYSVIHYRLGDNELVRNIQKKNFKLIEEHLRINSEKSDILLSDSALFKDYIKKQDLDIFMLNHPICHIGVSNDSVSIKNTLLELIILSRATSIKSYSVYTWISGFAYAVSKIYDIPLTFETKLASV